MRPLQNDMIVWPNLLDQLPQQGGHAADVDQAQQWVVGRSGDFVAFGSADGVGLMLAGVEQPVRRHWVAMSVKDFQIDSIVGVRAGTRNDILDPYRLPERQPDKRVTGEAVPHGGWRVVARRAEVSLPVDQRVAQRPRLRHPDQGVVDRRVAVRVVVTHRLGDRPRRLGVAAVRAEPGVEHRIEHPTVHRLEAVAHFGQCAADDHAHRVIDVAALHLVLNVDGLDPVAGFAAGGQRSVCHLFLIREISLGKCVRVSDVAKHPGSERLSRCA